MRNTNYKKLDNIFIERWSPRAFLPDPITDEDIKNIPGLKKYIEKDGQKIPNRIYTKNIGKPTAIKVKEQEEGNKSEAPIIAKNYI